MLRSLLIVLVLLISVAPIHAQTDTDSIAYGDTVEGRITQVNFETVYTFEAEADDIVSITVRSASNSGLDAYLYLTTPLNESIAENDDFYQSNPAIITKIRNAGTYQIVVSRYGGRTGSSEGAYTLTLEKMRSAQPGITMEGRAVDGDASPMHVFVPESAGVYTLTYKHIRGDYFPAIRIFMLPEGDSYQQEIGAIQANVLHGGELTTEMRLDAIYIFSLTPYSYYNSDLQSFADYTLQINPIEDE